MLTTDHFFLLYFFPLFIIIYLLVKNRIGVGNLVIILFSIFFYSSFGIENLPILIIPLLADFIIAIQIFKTSNTLVRRLILGVAIILNLGILGYYKYAGFAVANINLIFPQANFLRDFTSNIILPVGISFITFQRISYLVDTYRKKIIPEMSLVKYGTYACLFPHLLAGPIVRYSEIKSQLSKRIVTSDTIYMASQLLVAGLGFKVLIADQIFLVEENLTAKLIDLNSLESILLVLLFSFRIYFDFLGYSMMALGLAKFIGFDFPINFNSPYQSLSITEFWRRWNITLSSWLRDYLYIPLGGNRKGEFRLYINLLVTMLLAGLWHGASWNFVIWGGIHGTFLAIERFFKIHNNFFGRVLLFPNLVRNFYLFCIVTIAWIVFKFETLTEVNYLLENIFRFQVDKFDFVTGNLLTSAIPAIFGAVIWAFFFKEIRIPTEKFSYKVVFLMVFIFILSIVISFIRKSVPFIYFQF